MQWLINNWTLLASIFAAVALAGIKVRNYLKLSAEEQKGAKQKAADRLIKAVSDWLLGALAEAEEDLGGGTGKIKIRAVYGKAIEIFGPELAQILTLEQLDAMAQAPLTELRDILKQKASEAEAKEGNDEVRRD